MNKKIIVTISVILIYVILYGSFIKVFKETFECGEYYYCIRFCSEDTKAYPDKLLLNDFLKSKSGSRWEKSKVDKFRTYRGYPGCGEMKFISPNENLTSYRNPYNFNYRASIKIDEEKYDFKRYCLEKSDYVEDGWKLMVCEQDVYYHKIFHLTAISFAVFVFGIIIFVYSYFKELQDFYGKFTIAFVTTQVIAYVVVPFILFNKDHKNISSLFQTIIVTTYTLSMMMILLWITAMIIHSFLTFKNFKDQLSKQYDFSIFAIFVVTFIAFSAFTLLLERTSYESGLVHLFTIYFFIGFVDIILLIVSGIKMLTLSRHLTHTEQPLFDNERKWYWITVKLSLMMLVTWPFVFFTWTNNYFNLLSNILSDFVMILTAITVAIILIGRKEVKILLFRKYRGILNVEA